MIRGAGASRLSSGACHPGFWAHRIEAGLPLAIYRASHGHVLGSLPSTTLKISVNSDGVLFSFWPSQLVLIARQRQSADFPSDAPLQCLCPAIRTEHLCLYLCTYRTCTHAFSQPYNVLKARANGLLQSPSGIAAPVTDCGGTEKPTVFFARVGTSVLST